MVIGRVGQVGNPGFGMAIFQELNILSSGFLTENLRFRLEQDGLTIWEAMLNRDRHPIAGV